MRFCKFHLWTLHRGKSCELIYYTRFCRPAQGPQANLPVKLAGKSAPGAQICAAPGAFLGLWRGQGGLLRLLLLVQTVEQVPDAQHVLDAQRTVILAVAGAAGAGAFLPQLAAVVGADVALKAAVMVGAQDLDDAGLAAAVAVGASLKSPLGKWWMLRMWANAMRSQCLRTMSATLLLGLAFRLPEHSVRQLYGSSTIDRKRSMLSASTSRRGRPKISHGGSSMWMAILMSHSRQVGISASRKYFRLSTAFPW